MTALSAIALEQIGEIIDQKLDQKLDQKIDEKINPKFERVFNAIHTLQEAHMQHFQITLDIQRRVVVLEDSMVDAQESLDFLTMAEEKDAEATINHEFRLAKLEEATGVEVVSPKHLSDLE